ncbi:hypothetical protein GLOTRDRAFT_102217 [Gloeophyllum trabeum ATCC 11539]|uniref:Ubiquitin-like domain-containing protein n=1 Tax=Gloeophyllum trabeum (strain ATCC 11539 / FP-39264 / Madison 617) TaxID=670483 RepID=S7QPS8_GLOTA|nr:uncharacterized protein GLOTRDRAFT_102217 [Gloeophyllum trabeum ATCC 11539]EPQ61402.1 hypothetical protein GLOTRDRAFT_102217 [Gloeophyllum trabeum ATCC 11539]
MNGASVQTNGRTAKPPPTGPAPPAPASAPPVPPNHTQPQQPPRSNSHGPPPAVNGAHSHPQKGKKKNEPPPVDPATMYESLKNRIAALEEEEVHEEEEERKFAEEAQKSVKGMGENAIHAKYIELFAELKRMERDHAKEKQKLVKDKDAAKSQLTKANQTKTKMENLARELQKDNKKLREDSKRLAQCVEDAQDEIAQMKSDMAKRAEKAKLQDVKYREMPDIVVKVVCRYRQELFFKISRKTKLSRLFNAWTERMETSSSKKVENVKALPGPSGPSSNTQVNGTAKLDGDVQSGPSSNMQFIFSHGGRTLEADETPEEAGLEDGDEILAVELMDLTDGPETDALDERVEVRRQKLKKHWTENPREAKKSLEDMFDIVVRERLKEVLRQYELRERHFECVIRSKELEVLLSRARAAEQKQVAEGEKARAEFLEEQKKQMVKELESAQEGQNMLIDKLISCCTDPQSERTQRIFASLREELERRRAAAAAPPPDPPSGD